MIANLDVQWNDDPDGEIAAWIGAERECIQPAQHLDCTILVWRQLSCFDGQDLARPNRLRRKRECRLGTVCQQKAENPDDKGQ